MVCFYQVENYHVNMNKRPWYIFELQTLFNRIMSIKNLKNRPHQWFRLTGISRPTDVLWQWLAITIYLTNWTKFAYFLYFIIINRSKHPLSVFSSSSSFSKCCRFWAVTKSPWTRRKKWDFNKKKNAALFLSLSVFSTFIHHHFSWFFEILI